jgi:hypothetical protein
MTTYTTTIARPKLQTQVLKWFDSEQYTMENVTVAPQAAALQLGTVMGVVTASGKWTPINFGASDGSQTAAGILLEGLPVSASDALNVPMIVREAVVQADGLVWPAGATAPQIATATAQLYNGGNGMTHGIVVRT